MQKYKTILYLGDDIHLIIDGVFNIEQLHNCKVTPEVTEVVDNYVVYGYTVRPYKGPIDLHTFCRYANDEYALLWRVARAVYNYYYYRGEMVDDVMGIKDLILKINSYELQRFNGVGKSSIKNLEMVQEELRKVGD